MLNSANDLYEMELHERRYVSDEIDVTRVPGGWIYTKYRLDQQAMTSVFVPFDNEFQPIPPPTDKF